MSRPALSPLALAPHPPGMIKTHGAVGIYLSMPELILYPRGAVTLFILALGLFRIRGGTVVPRRGLRSPGVAALLRCTDTYPRISANHFRNLSTLVSANHFGHVVSKLRSSAPMDPDTQVDPK